MSKRVETRYTLLPVGALLALWVVSSTPAFAQKPGDQQLNWGGTDTVSERGSGEIAVHSPTLLLSGDGTPYSATISFGSQDEYLKSLALGTRGINLADLDDAWYAEDSEKFVVVQKPGDQGVFALAKKARGTICGTTLVRGTIKLENGVTVGVSVSHAKADDFAHDIHGACDFFAAGGCGTDACYNSRKTPTGVRIYKGDCREFEVIGPNGCYCHSTSIIHTS